MHGDEEATMAMLSARRALVDELIGRHRGRIANTAGDSVLAEFASVLDAVHCAVEIQEALARANDGEPDGRRMLFRIGVNVGDVMFKEGDIFGDGVNVAARLEGLVRGGEICVSRGVHDHLRHRGMAFDDLGEQLVKNIAHPIRAFRLRIGGDQSEQEAPTSGELAGSPDAPSASPAISELSADNEVALELALWDSVKDGSPAELESYLEQYPEGTFASLARTRLDATALCKRCGRRSARCRASRRSSCNASSQRAAAHGGDRWIRPWLHCELVDTRAPVMSVGSRTSIAVHARIPMVMPDELRALQLENAEAVERQWSAPQAISEEKLAGHKAVATKLKQTIADDETAAAGAGSQASRAKDRITRLKAGENVAGIDKPLDLIREFGFTMRGLRSRRRSGPCFAAI